MPSVIFTSTDLMRFERLMDQYKSQIGAKMKMYGKWVTGTTWNSLTPYAYVTSSNELHTGLNSSNPILLKQLETGRAPGKVPYNFERTLFDWSLHKGLSFHSYKDRWRFAKALSWKIKREGTTQFRSGVNNDIFTSMAPSYDKQLSVIMTKCFAGHFHDMKLNFL